MQPQPGSKLVSHVRSFRHAWRATAVGLALVSGAPAVDLPPVWRWSNPRPHGANVVDQATIGPLTVQVAERGQIFTSEAWDVWAPRDSHTTAALRGATFFGGRLVLTGEAGTVLFADDPYRFYLLNLGTTNWLESVAASSEVVVAVGDNAAIYFSTNAVTWERASTSFNHWLRSVACNGTTFVTVGEGGLIATSQNGATWQRRNIATTTNLNRVAWLGDHFLAVGDGGLALTSPAGSSWTPVSLGATNDLFALAGVTNTHLAAGNLEARLSQTNGPWRNQMATALAAPVPVWTYYSALWNSGYYLLAGRSGLCVEGSKTNGTAATTWRPLADSVRTWLWSVMRTPSHYVAVGDYGTLLTSPNGIDWDLELVPDSVTNSVLLGVGGSSNQWIAVGSHGTVLWATNVFLWNAVPQRPTTNDLQGVCFTGERFILCGGNGTLLTSTVGTTNWNLRATPTTAFLMSVEAWPGGVVAVGENGVILTSTNGIAWAQQPSGTTNWLSQVRYRDGRLIAVGENGTILTSSDATNWVSRNSGTTAWLNAVDFLEDTWFIAGNQGTFLGSPDATNWFNFGTATKKSLYGLTIANGQLITVGLEGVILRSQLVPDPTPIAIAEFAHLSGMNLFLFTGAPDQQFVLESSADLDAWTDGPWLEFLDGTGTLILLETTTANAGPAQYYRTRRER